MTPRCRELIQQLKLQPHPEGGYYREIYRSSHRVGADALPEEFDQPRHLATAIHFQIPAGLHTKPHRLHAEELWLFIEGDPVRLRVRKSLDDDAQVAATLLEDRGNRYAIVPEHHWQDAEVLDGEHGYALVACIVSPGFEFDDFELGANDDA